MCSCFFFNDPATTEIYPLPLHDALPIWHWRSRWRRLRTCRSATCWASTKRRTSRRQAPTSSSATRRSEEHTSELQSRQYLVCRLLLEKKKNSNCRSYVYQYTHYTRPQAK